MEDFTRQKGEKSFYLRLIVPVILTITAYIISIYVIFIPSLENNLIREKKQMIRELTQSAWSILQEYHEKELSGQISGTEAREKAVNIIQGLRYGDESKDYFWITDMTPIMIVHPYRPDLMGTNLEDYQDPNGKKLFIESVSVVEKNGEGFIDYFWQWKDDDTRIVPKLSFVKGFVPWDWVIGTGIYIEDIDAEILRLKKNLIWVSLGIILLVAGILAYILRTSLLLENKRKKAVTELKESRERYRSLVEASKEGTILSFDGKINYVNPFLLDRFGYSAEDLNGREPEMLFDPEDIETLEALKEFMKRDDGFIQLETKWKDKNGINQNVILNISRTKVGEKSASIFIVKELSSGNKMAKQIEELGQELQTSLLFMNQAVNIFARKPLICNMNDSIRTCAEIMTLKNENSILIQGPGDEYIGIVTDRDLRHRVVAKGKNPNEAVYGIMSSPLISISENSLLFEVLLSFQQNKVTHIAIKDANGGISGLISHQELLQMHQNTTEFLMRQIQLAERSDELIQYSSKTRGIVRVLEQSGARSRNITRIVTTVNDALTKRFIELAIAEAGPPPVPFAFIALGSEGRGEQTLATDQDNGIIFQDPQEENREDCQAYFLKVGHKVNTCLDLAGYNLCKGGVMAGNKQWCQSVSKWESNIKEWISNPGPQSVMQASIFLDFRMVYGDLSITEDIQNFVDGALLNQPAFFFHMADQSLKFKTSGDLSGLFKIDSATGIKVFDSKRVLFPLSSFVRINAISSGIVARGTLDRIHQLNNSGFLTDQLSQKISEGFDFLMMLRYKSQLMAIEADQEINNKVPEEILTDMDKVHLKKVIRTISELQVKLRLDFNIS